MIRQNLIRLAIIVNVTITFTGCVENSKNTEEIGNNQNPIQEQLSFQWTYQSVIGVMDSLSCYCFNGGYLTSHDWKKIPLCWENNDATISCTNLSVTGQFKTKSIDPDSSNPCPAGEMKYLVVENYECK